MLFIGLLLGWGSLPVLIVLAFILVRQKLHRIFPWFFCYIIINVLVGFIRFVAYSRLSWNSYDQIYWTLSIVGSIFAIMAVYEVFVRRLFIHFQRVGFYRFLFFVAALVVAILAVLTASWPDKWLSLFGVADRTLVFVRVALLGFFTLVMIFMGREWTRYELGIAFGFGVLTAMAFFSSAMLARSTQLAYSVRYLPTIAWDVACIIWLISFRKRVASAEGGPELEHNAEMLEEARKWRYALRNWLLPKNR